MTTATCVRCDWTGRPADLEFHTRWHPPRPWGDHDCAIDHRWTSNHPLCSVCTGSLPDDRPMICVPCVAAVRRDLGRIEAAAVRLALNLGRTSSSALNPGRPIHSDSRPLPGGDALSLLGPGSDGSRDPVPVQDREPEHAPSITAELWWWARDWRTEFGHGHDDDSGTLSGTLTYLSRHLDWAAREHPAFDAFAGDVGSLASRAHKAAGHDTPIETGAPCLRCHQALHRDHDDDGARLDSWTCPGCHDRYSDQRYILAKANHLRSLAHQRRWLTVAEASQVSGRSRFTITAWMGGKVAAACRIQDRRIVVASDELHTATVEAGRRRRAS